MWHLLDVNVGFNKPCYEINQHCFRFDSSVIYILIIICLRKRSKKRTPARRIIALYMSIEGGNPLSSSAEDIEPTRGAKTRH